MTLNAKHKNNIFCEYLRQLRVKHWLKNGLVVLPALCAGILLNQNLFGKVILAFFSFSFLSSAIYIINDLKDVEKDRLNQNKKNRPIARGSISIDSAKLLCVCMILSSLAVNYILNRSPVSSWICLILYFVLNIGYSFGLKNIPLIDIVILVSGFFLRVWYGSIISGVVLSNWMYLVIICFSFYLSLGKRRNELAHSGSQYRDSLKYYTKGFLDKNMYMCLGLTITFFALWTVDSSVVMLHGSGLTMTVPLVLIICIRYSMNIENPVSSGDPVDVLLGDKVLIVLSAIFILVLFYFIYSGVLF